MIVPPIERYAGREQAWVKHYFLASYVQRLMMKLASVYNDIVYVDGFSGPWQNQGEDFGDTSFGISLEALRQAKAEWKRISGRDVRMTALLVEKNPVSHRRLQEVRPLYPEIEIETFEGDFVDLVPKLLDAIPRNAFSFTLMDPKGWAIDMEAVAPLLKRPRSEVVFNFMFDFINRSASMSQPLIQANLDKLLPGTDWKRRLESAIAQAPDGMASGVRKDVLVSAVREAVGRLGGFPYVLETPVFYPLSDRTFYSLIYATRNPVGVEVFRDSQHATLKAQDELRGQLRVAKVEADRGMSNLFADLPVTADDYLGRYVAVQEAGARQALLSAAPAFPASVKYGDVWPAILAEHGIRKSRLGRIAAEQRTEGSLRFPDWMPRKQVPAEEYRFHR